MWLGVAKCVTSPFEKNSVSIFVGCTSDDHTLVIIHKTDGRNGPPDLKFNGADGACVEGSLYFFKRGKNAIENTLQLINRVCAESITNIAIVAPPKGVEFSFERIMHLTRNLTEQQIAVLKGKCNAVHYKQRNEFEAAFLRVFLDPKVVRELESRSNSVFISALHPHIDVPAFELFTGLHQTGHRLREVSMEEETYTLLDLFHTSAITKYGVIVIGSSRTTGYGKTSVCLRLALEWSKSYHLERKTPVEDAVVVFTNTIDSARDVPFRPGMVWVVDEMNPSDREQLVHASENSFKTLLNPTLTRTIRARNKDFVVPAMVRILLTGNAESFENWFGSKICWSPPIRRKSIAFKITEPLLSAQVRDPDNLRENADAEAVATAMRARLQVPVVAAPAPQPQSLASRLMHGVHNWLFTGL